MKNLHICLVLITLVFTLSLQALSQIPKTIAYQGVLTDILGNPVSDSVYSTTFRFYNPENTVIWDETQLVQTRRGLFSVLLGSTVPFPDSLKFDRPYKLGIQIFGEAQLVPLIPLNSVGYSLSALRSDTANIAEGISSTVKVSNADSVSGIAASFNQLPNTLYPLDSLGGITLVSISGSSNRTTTSTRSHIPLGTALQPPSAFLSIAKESWGCVIRMIPGAECFPTKAIEVSAGMDIGVITAGSTYGILAQSDGGSGVYAHSLSGIAPALRAKHEVTGGTAAEFDGNVVLNGTLGGNWTSTAGGDLAGIFPVPFVNKIQGYPVSALAPSTGQVLKWDGSFWAPGTDLTGGGSGVTNISQGNGISLSPNPITTTGTVSINFAGSGFATTVSRSDHNHFGDTWSGSGVGLILSSSTASSLSGSSSADFGIVGTSSATNKAGVKGDGGSSSYGVAGYSSNSSSYAGVYGKNLTTNAVGALANGGVGVYGTGTTWAGSFDGNVNVNNGYLNVAWTAGGSTNAINSTNNGAYSAVNGVNTGSGVGVRGESQGATGTGVYAKKTNGNYALYVEGTAYFTGLATFAGSKSGYVVDICYNAGPGVLEQGDVVEITGSMDPVIGDIPVAKVQKCHSVSSSRIMGVVENRYDVQDSSRSLRPIRPGDYLSVVTLGAFKIINVDATTNAIQPGDLLTSSSVPGYAIRASNPGVGSVIGKALESLPTGRGKIRVFVSAK